MQPFPSFIKTTISIYHDPSHIKLWFQLKMTSLENALVDSTSHPPAPYLPSIPQNLTGNLKKLTMFFSFLFSFFLTTCTDSVNLLGVNWRSFNRWILPRNFLLIISHTAFLWFHWSRYTSLERTVLDDLWFLFQLVCLLMTNRDLKSD